MNTLHTSLRYRLAGAGLPVLLLAVLALAWVTHTAKNNHGGAFEGPCTYHASSNAGPVAELKLTDYGPAVQVDYLVVEERDASGLIINANRAEIATAVGRNQTATFSVPAIAGGASCRLLNWG